MALAWGMRGWEVEYDETPTGDIEKVAEKAVMRLNRCLSDSALDCALARSRGSSEDGEAASTASRSSASRSTAWRSTADELPDVSGTSGCSASSQLGDEPHSDDASSTGGEKLRDEVELAQTLELQDGSSTVARPAPGGGLQPAAAAEAAQWMMPPQGYSPGMIIYVPVAFGTPPMAYEQAPAYEPAPCQGSQSYATAPAAPPAREDARSAERSSMEMDIAAAQLKAAARRAEANAKKAPKQKGQQGQKGQQKQAPQPPQSAQGSRTGTGALSCKFEERTSVMLRNLPNDYTLGMLLSLLDAEGFSARYDFAYLPVDFTRWAGFGYAFVNMVSHEDALAAWRHFQGFDSWQVASQKVCEVCWGDPLQGLAAHVERYRNSPVMHEGVPDGCKPAVFCEGRRIAFPPPTKRIRAPRAKQPGHGRMPETVNRLQRTGTEDVSGVLGAPPTSSSGVVEELKLDLSAAWEAALSRKP